MWHNTCSMSELVGKTPIAFRGGNGDDVLELTMSDGSVYQFYHQQSCCESVYIEDIAGDINDLLNSEITVAEERESNEPPLSRYHDDYKWTFYELGTARGYATIRWYGHSNGYYGVGVNLYRVSSPTESTPSF